MTRRMFKSLLLVGLAAVILCTVLFSAILIRRERAQLHEQLAQAAAQAAQAFSLGGADALQTLNGPFRISLQAADGKPLCGSMEEDTGLSCTQTLPDGTVIRVTADTPRYAPLLAQLLPLL